MPFIENRQIDFYSNLLVWQIAENTSELSKLVSLSDEDQMLFNSFKSGTRRREYLATKLLLTNCKLNRQVKYSEIGAPYFEDNKEYISISHSNLLITVLISKKECGIDVEQITPRASKIVNKFLSNEEIKLISGPYLETNAILFWTVKEAIYKFLKKQNVIFKTQIKITYFSWKTKFVEAYYIGDDKEMKFLLSFDKIFDYITTIIIDNE